MYPALNFEFEYTLEDMYDDMVKLSSSDRITWMDSFDGIKDYQDYYNKILSSGLYNAQFIVVNIGNKSSFEYDTDEVLRFYSSNQCCAVYLYNTLLYFNSTGTPKFITDVLGRINMASYDRFYI